MPYEPLAAESRQLERRRKLLEAMQAQALQPRQTQMVSGRAVPMGIGEGLTQLAQAYMTGKGLEGVGEKEKELAGKYETGRSDATQRVMDAMMGKPQTGGPLRPEAIGPEGYQQIEPAVASDPMKAAMTAATDPYLAQDKGLQGVTQALMKAQAPGSSSPYFTTFIGKDGNAYRFNARSGEVDPLDLVAGKLDPETQANIARGKETGKLEAQAELKPDVEADIVTSKARAEYEEANRQRSESMPGIVSMARNILETGKPTSSGVGTAFDYTASMFGFSPEGASAADQLRALGGGLTSKMPRMEGPQSDRDTMLYREMAGRVGDSTLPVERRLAALKVVEDMWSKPPSTPYDEFAGKTGESTQTSAPEGVPPDVWDVMTDEEKALWP